MGYASKSFVLILILIMAILTLSLLTIEPACAQSIPMPSVPQFTVKLINETYSVTTTNPYTEVNTTQRIDNASIEITIENQPFSPYWDTSVGSNITLFYNIRLKGHFAENWTYPYSPENGYPTQSTSEDTILSMPANYPTGGQVDFQVQAMIGYLQSTPSLSLPLGGYSFMGQTSDWSNTQTITVPASIPLSSSSPTSAPAVPELSWLAITLLMICLFSVAVLMRLPKLESYRSKDHESCALL